MIKTKVVVTDEFYNFVFDDFFIWNHLVFQNFVQSSHISKFKFWIVQTKSDGEMTKTKVVDLDELFKFVVEYLSFEIIFYLKILFEVLVL